MTPLDRVLNALDVRDCKPHRSGDGYKALCPAHDDRNPSLSITVGTDDRVLLHCHADCSIERVLDALAVNASELFEERESTIVETYAYTDEHGELLYEVVRFDPKDFRQRRSASQNTCDCQQCKKALAKGSNWLWNLHKIERVLYRLPRVLKAIEDGKWVVVVEGEKDVHELEKIGQVATTLPGGAGKWRDEYSETLRGAKVAIVRDRDQPNKQGVRVGEQHALQVAESLKGKAERIVHYEPAVGKDIADHLKAGLAMSKLIRPDVIVPREKAQLELLSAKAMMELPTPDKAGQLLGPLLYRGYRVVIGGHTGHGKSSFTLRMLASAVYGREFLGWTGQGNLRALVIDVEQGVYTVQRCIREVGLQQSECVQYLRVPDGLALDTDPDMVLAMEGILRNGQFDIVLADPLYKLHRGDPNDAQSATELMRRFDDWRDRFGFALLMPMHCRKPHPNTKLSVHDLFGSSAYQWGAEVLMGIERKGDGYAFLHWWKDRDGLTGAPIGTHWPLLYDRQAGYTRHEQVKDRFVLSERVYELVRDNDAAGLTRDQLRSILWNERREVTVGQIDTALARLSSDGVTHNGVRLKKDRVYRLPMQIMGADAAVTRAG